MNKIRYIIPFLLLAVTMRSVGQDFPWPPDKVRDDFKKMLERPHVRANPVFQRIETDSLIIEKGFIDTEAGERMPLLIWKPAKGNRFPVVICQHGTGGNKENWAIKELMGKLVKHGIMGVSIDARYHGERVMGGAHGAQEYVEAITRSWRERGKPGQEHPFFYDTSYDLWRLTDYLVTRPDVIADRIGMMGISMGGIQIWMAAAVDTRIKVSVIAIGAQSFKWSLDNDQWQGRVGTIRPSHEAAAVDLGHKEINKQNITAFWDAVLPGITGEFDCPSMIRLLAPRPLLILSTEKDQNCPIGGATVAFEAARGAYKATKSDANLSIHVAPNEPHRYLPAHNQMTLDWFLKWL